MENIGSGRFDAQDNPLTNIYNFGVHNHHPYIALTGHFYGESLLVCNETRYQGWAPGVRAAVDEAAAEATAFQRQLAAAEDGEMMGKFDRGKVEIAELTAAERAAFVEALRPVPDRHRRHTIPGSCAVSRSTWALDSRRPYYGKRGNSTGG
jgi:TRAP-type C4-dicarboxylate transport system substrate-binding protein